jgi:hypothetical protein
MAQRQMRAGILLLAEGLHQAGRHLLANSKPRVVDAAQPKPTPIAFGVRPSPLTMTEAARLTSGSLCSSESSSIVVGLSFGPDGSPARGQAQGE